MKEIISRIKLIEAKIGLYFYLQLTWEKKLDMITNQYRHHDQKHP